MRACMRVRSNRLPGVKPPSKRGRKAAGVSARAVLIWAPAQPPRVLLSQAGTGEAKPSLSRLAQTSRGRPRALAASRRIRLPWAGSLISCSAGSR